jgi:hypothetical protein
MNRFRYREGWVEKWESGNPEKSPWGTLRLGFRFDPPHNDSRFVARLDRKRLGARHFHNEMNSMRGVFDKQTRRKPLVFAADAVHYGI